MTDKFINNALTYTKILLGIFLFVMPLCIYGQVDDSFDLYLLIGQSNMAGRGEITDEYLKEGHPNVFMLDEENNWVLAKHPLHFDKL